MPAVSDVFILNIDDGWKDRLPASAFGQFLTFAKVSFQLAESDMPMNSDKRPAVRCRS